jgi:flagellar biosynthesis/type III secretory pathway M-ring protein FliF/YscJ
MRGNEARAGVGTGPVQGFFDFVKSLGAARMAAMAAVTLALIGFFSFLMIRMTEPQMVPLFTDLSIDDSASIIKDLDRQGIPYTLKDNGAIIMVPTEKVARLRMSLAESGLPKGGGIGYEIFDKSDALGATTFIQNINRLRALEGELARSIRSLDRVQAARVHLVMPERPLFSRDKVEATASIVLRVRGSLAPTEVRAIRHLVASAVKGLKPDRGGDQVEVVNLPFADTPPLTADEPTAWWMRYLQFTKNDIMGAAEKGVMALLGLIVLFLVVRPLVRRVITPEGGDNRAQLAGAAGVAGALGVDDSAQDGNANGNITTGGGPNVSIVGGDETVAISNRTSAMIDVAKVQGQVHAQSVTKVGELAENNPHEAVAIIRSWLHEDAA